MGHDSRKNRNHVAIDESLKQVFQETLEEELPDRFKNLLEELKKKGVPGDRHGT